MDIEVENKLLQRAKGYEYIETTYERIENMVVEPDGSVNVIPGTKIKNGSQADGPRRYGSNLLAKEQEVSRVERQSRTRAFRQDRTAKHHNHKITTPKSVIYGIVTHYVNQISKLLSIIV